MSDMNYPSIPNFNGLAGEISLYSGLKHELGAQNIEQILARAEDCMKSALEELKKLPIDEELAKKEPSGLKDIHSLRPEGPRRFWQKFDKAGYRERIEGAFLGRVAGCILGSPIEFWSIDRMEALIAPFVEDE